MITHSLSVIDATLSAKALHMAILLLMRNELTNTFVRMVLQIIMVIRYFPGEK